MNRLRITGVFCSLIFSVTMKAQTSAPLQLSTLDGKTIDIPAAPSGSYRKVPPPAAEGFYAASRTRAIYITPDFKLEILPKDRGYLFKGKGSHHNQVLDSLQLLADSIFDLEYGLKDYWWKVEPAVFKSKMDEFRKAATQMIMRVKGSPYYNRAANAELNEIQRMIAGYYNFTYGMNPEKMKVVTEMQDRGAPKDSVSMMWKAAKEKELDAEASKMVSSLSDDSADLNDEELFIASAAYRNIHDYQLIKMTWKMPGRKGSREIMDSCKYQVAQQYISSKLIRDYYGFNYTAGILKNSDRESQLDSVYTMFMSLATTEKYKKGATDLYTKRKKFVNGAPSPSFSLPDTSGKVVTLESLRGKYVYIDLWATWCGPCKREIPFLKEMEAKFHGKNIAFVSISIDELRDKQKWMNFVKKEQLTGIQLMADKAWETAFVKDYTITGIPHFILLGPAGEIIEGRAKRPSEPELEKQLNELLSK